MVGLRNTIGVLVLAVAVAGCAPARSTGSPVTKVDSTENVVIEEQMTVATNELHNYGDDVPESDLNQPGVTDPSEAEVYDPFSQRYLIGANDVLFFRSFDNPELNQAVTVRYDGYISLPFIPDVNVLNLTREEATAVLHEAYSEIFIDPLISLTIQDSQSKFFTVMGEVEQPDSYPYERPITLLDAINAAGGQRINRRAGDAFVGQQGTLSKAILIRREPGGDREVYEYNLRDLSEPGFHESESPVFPGDIVYVPEGTNLVYIIGEVPQPSVYPLGSDMTLVEMLAQAGGVNFSRANLRRLVLLREVDEVNTDIYMVNLKHILNTGQDILLKPGDVIYVPRKDLTKLQEFVARFTGSISPMLGLYTQALNAWYEDDFIDAALDEDGANNLADIVQSLNRIGPGNLGSLNLAR